MNKKAGTFLPSKKKKDLSNENKQLRISLKEREHAISELHLRFAALEKETETLRKIAQQDLMTGLISRNYAAEKIDHTIKWVMRRFRGQSLKVSILFIDIDNLKQFNDAHGHEAGDSLIRVIAELMGRHFREEDLLIRYGGDEFVVIMLNASLETTNERAKNFQKMLGASDDPRIRRGDTRESVSIGCLHGRLPVVVPTKERRFSFDQITGKIFEMIAIADREMYKAKVKKGSIKFLKVQ